MGDWNNLFKTKKMKPADIVDISNGGSTKLADKLKKDLKIPEAYDVMIKSDANKGGKGIIFSIKGEEKYTDIRIMPGEPSAPFPNSREPYVKHKRDGRWLDVNGSKLETDRNRDAHIPLGDFIFK